MYVKIEVLIKVEDRGDVRKIASHLIKEMAEASRWAYSDDTAAEGGYIGGFEVLGHFVSSYGG